MAASESTSSRRQSIFSILGWFGFLFLIPLVLKSLGMSGIADFLAKNLGIWGSASFLLIYFYAFPLLDLVFGSDRHFLPLLTGSVASFLIFTIVVHVPFMEWYTKIFSGVPLVQCSLIFLVLGILAMILGLLLSYVRRGVGLFGQVLVIFGLPIAAGVAALLLHADKVLKLPIFPV